MGEKGTINLTFEGMSVIELERYRQLIQTLILQGVFNVRNGKVVLHFDHQGELLQIQKDVVSWRKDKDAPPLAKYFENVKIEIIKKP